MGKNRPNGNKIYQQLPLQDRSEFTQIWIFGLKIGVPSGNPGRKIRKALAPGIVCY
jgi:hypothetical protein